MAPIAELTARRARSRETRDPGRRSPSPDADDEVAELGRTLQDMLEASRRRANETEEALRRQRQFVADASHELRTPLTSMLANLELLAEVARRRATREAAESALRSSQRMRRLVGDLLLLARADANRAPAARADRPRRRSLVDAAAELGPIADDHQLTVDASPRSWTARATSCTGWRST